MSIQSSAQSVLWRLLAARSQGPDETFWRQKAVVFAPHQDDETLGCGGTVLAKKAKAAHVSIVFMTDGRLSHAGLISEADLIARRADEALAACHALNVAAEDVYFLNIPDGRVTQQKDTAVPQIVKLLSNLRPEQIFVPYRHEPPPDHYSTTHAVLAALEQIGQPVEVYEYPVWAWYHWPWVGLGSSALGDRRAILKNTATMLFGLRLFADLRLSVDINDLVGQKRAALAEHQSQMSRLLPDTRWLTLADVSDGEWLDCFFRGKELFHHYSFSGNGPTPPTPGDAAI
ncbi:MAG: PIG-L family deacetylase [Chloroflexi bacterium]|nr:PIG-L family deacetylase [Chloroflexota bacterium]